MFLPPPRRRAITALYAFCREVDDVVDETSDPGVAAREARVVAHRGQRRVRRHAAASGRAGARAGRPRVPAEGGGPADGHRRHGDGPRAPSLPRLRRAAPLLRPRRRRRRPHVGGDLRLRESGDARLRPRSRHRVPAHQHHPRRRRGCAPRPHLSSAGRARAPRRRGVGAAAARGRRRVSRTDGGTGGARARLVHAGARRAAGRGPRGAAARAHHGGDLRRASRRDRARRLRRARDTGSPSRRCASSGSPSARRGGAERA